MERVLRVLAWGCLAFAGTLAILAGWSYFRWENVGHSGRRGDQSVIVARGRIRLNWDFDSEHLPQGSSWRHEGGPFTPEDVAGVPTRFDWRPVNEADPDAGETDVRRSKGSWLGVHWSRSSFDGDWFWLAWVPAAYPIAGLVAVGWGARVMARRVRRRRRLAAGLCPECGYDARASPGRCTECGWAA